MLKMIVSVVFAPERRAGKAEVGEVPTVKVPTEPVNSAAESFSVPMAQPAPGGGVLVGVAVAPPGWVGVFVGGLAKAVEDTGTREPRLSNIENIIGRASQCHKCLIGECFGVNMIVISLV
jgi:hypothetical protein